jgi:hypothetical protein
LLDAISSGAKLKKVDRTSINKEEDEHDSNVSDMAAVLRDRMKEIANANRPDSDQEDEGESDNEWSDESDED